jgi:hypothetical protein
MNERGLGRAGSESHYHFMARKQNISGSEITQSVLVVLLVKTGLRKGKVLGSEEPKTEILLNNI